MMGIPWSNDHQPCDVVRLSSPHPEEDAVTFFSEPPWFAAATCFRRITSGPA